MRSELLKAKNEIYELVAEFVLSIDERLEEAKEFISSDNALAILEEISEDIAEFLK